MRPPLERWERRAEVPLLLLSAAFLVAWAWPILDPRLDNDLEQLLQRLSWAVWAAFTIDFAARIYLAAPRLRYVAQHWYDVALVVLPVLRPLRLLRLLTLVRILNRSAATGLAGRVGIYVAGTALAAIGLGAVAVLDAERGADDANITTIGDALWWAVTTVTTVGYGDRYPVTTSGRFIAFALMLIGIAVVGSLTAIIAAWLVESVERSKVEQVEDSSPPASRSRSSELQPPTSPSD